MIMKRVLFACLGFIIQLSIYGQNLVLKGNVIDQQKVPVMYASVALMDKEEKSLISGTISDTSGHFSFTNLKAGEYVLSVSFLGYKNFKTSIVLNKEFHINCLLADDTVALNEVVVEANRSNIVKNSAVGQTFMLSENALKKKDIMLALQEIPTLSIDPDTRKITTIDGGKPLVLINGIRRDGGISTINPEDILSVEVVQSVSAEFMREGYTSVINIKTKKNSNRYKMVNAGVSTHPTIRFGIADFSFETGNDNASFYTSAQSFAFLNNKSKMFEKTTTTNNIRELSSKRNSNYNETDVSIGGDKLWSDKNYSSYSFTLRYLPQSNEALGTSLLIDRNENRNAPYTYERTLDNKTYVGSINAYHKHIFENKSIIDLLYQISLSKNTNEVNQTEFNSDDNILRNYNFSNTRVKSSLTASYNFRIEEVNTKIGVSSQYQHNEISEKVSSYSSFKHREWNEYLFMNVNRTWKKISLAASIGMDAIFRNVENYNENFYNIRSMLIMNYKINPHHSIGFNYNMYSDSPAITDLNPYNNSSDTLTISKGNPSLKPYHVHKFRLMYSLAKNKIYISPSFSYQLINDAIVSIGEEQDSYYIKTLANQGKSSLFTCGSNIRYSIGKLGYVGFLFNYNHVTYSTINQRNDYFSGRFYGGLTYKKISMNINYGLPSHNYDLYTHGYSSPESNMRLTYNVSKKWDLSLGMRYIASIKHVKEWVNMPGYSYYFENDFTNRGNIIMFGVRYKSYNNKKAKREQKKLQNDEKGFEIISQ